MRALLIAADISEGDIWVDDRAKNTVQSTRIVVRLVRENCDDCGAVFVITDTYHEWRCRALLYLLGVRTTRAVLTNGVREEGYWRWGWYCLREQLVSLKDIPTALAWRAFG